MKTLIRCFKDVKSHLIPNLLVAAACTSIWVALVLVPVSVLAQTNGTPLLSIAPTGTNDVVNVTVMNGDSQIAYSILYSLSPDLNSFTNPVHKAIGSIGQTNFSFSLGADLYGFYRATGTSDWDGDGVENWKDAQPYSTNVGLLSVTIELPTNGSTIY